MFSAELWISYDLTPGVKFRWVRCSIWMVVVPWPLEGPFQGTNTIVLIEARSEPLHLIDTIPQPFRRQISCPWVADLTVCTVRSVTPRSVCRPDLACGLLWSAWSACWTDKCVVSCRAEEQARINTPVYNLPPSILSSSVRGCRLPRSGPLLLILPQIVWCETWPHPTSNLAPAQHRNFPLLLGGPGPQNQMELTMSQAVLGDQTINWGFVCKGRGIR